MFRSDAFARVVVFGEGLPYQHEEHSQGSITPGMPVLFLAGPSYSALWQTLFDMEKVRAESASEEKSLLIRSLRALAVYDSLQNLQCAVTVLGDRIRTRSSSC